MTVIHLFGASTPTGEAFRRQASCSKNLQPIKAYSRNNPELTPLDFRNPESFKLDSPEEDSIWISFGPIWLLAGFLEYLEQKKPKALYQIKGVIACSSSSASTKRYAFNAYDKELAQKLISSEERIQTLCQRNSVHSTIIRPTMIYGHVGPYQDSNISRLSKAIATYPFILFPRESGKRQPIHASQLAAIALKMAADIQTNPLDAPKLLEVGGDETLSYLTMLKRLQASNNGEALKRRCKLFTIPNQLFFFFAAPIALFSLKRYEAVLRIGADLSGFTPAGALLEQTPALFPVINPTGRRPENLDC